MADPIVSVVIPCHNGASYLEACVRSVRAQNVESEILIVDDGSTDESAATAVGLMQSDPERMLLVRQVNQGQAVARNAGIRLTRGRYICFLDVDDEYLPGFFSAAVEILERDRAAIGVEGKIEPTNPHRPIERWQIEAMEATAPGNLLLRTETVRLMGGFPVDPAFRGKGGGEDVCLRKHLSMVGPLRKLDRPVLKYLVRPGGHVDLFLDRARREPDGRITFTETLPEERDGSLTRAFRRYRNAVADRMLERAAETIRTELATGLEFLRYANWMDQIPDSPDSAEEAVQIWAKRWPVFGRSVYVGAPAPRMICRLAAGCRSGGFGKVTAVCEGGANDAIAPRAEELRGIVERIGLAGIVDIVASGTGSGDSREPVRMLVLGPELSEDSVARAIELHATRIPPHGLLLLRPSHGRAKRDPAVWLPLSQSAELSVFQKAG